MTVGMTPENRSKLIGALIALADQIESNPPPIIGSDIFVQAAPGGRAIGSQISVIAGPGGGGGTGQKITVVATQPGQTVIGQRMGVVFGGGPISTPPASAGSKEEIDDVVRQLRDAANALSSSPASEGWIKGTLEKVSRWGSSALNGAISGVSSALVQFYLTPTK